MIGGAGHDEHGKYSGGKAGDQTGREAYIKPWYSRPWNYILRCKKQSMRKKIAKAMKAACNNKNIGYNQNQRNTLWNAVKSVGFDPSKVIKPVNTDCSALVSVCCAYAGVPIKYLQINGNSLTTSVLRSKLVESGLFDVLTDLRYLTSDKYLKEGDILLYEGHHTEVNLNDGVCANIKNKVRAKITGNTDTNPYKKPSKTITTKSKKNDVKWLQWELNQWKSSLAVDGILGANTTAQVKAFQKAKGLAVDGIAGVKTISALVKDK